MFQMQIYIIVVLLLYSGAVSGGLEEVLRLAGFIADIYQHFPHKCIFFINSEAKVSGENEFYIIYLSYVLLLEKTLLVPVIKESAYRLLHLTRKFVYNYTISMIEKLICFGHLDGQVFFQNFVPICRFLCWRVSR
jgi:hypothetical protein